MARLEARQDLYEGAAKEILKGTAAATPAGASTRPQRAPGLPTDAHSRRRAAAESSLCRPWPHAIILGVWVGYTRFGGAPALPKRRSAVKRLRQSRERRLRNSAAKSRAKTAVAKARHALAGGDREAAQALVGQATRLLDRAASKGAIHPNAAARRRSALARLAGA